VSAALDLDVSGIRLRFEGIPDEETAVLRELWSGYVVATEGTPAYRVGVREGARSLTPGSVLPSEMMIEPLPGGMRYQRDEAELTVGEAQQDSILTLAHGDAKRRAWGIVNLLPALLGWHLAERGGGALHAAGIVLEGGAYLLLGAEGSGKTTFASIAAERGVPVLSDDVVLVESSGAGLVALGAPIRDRSFPAPGPGRWPVAALLLSSFGSPPGLEPISRLACEPRLAANLLYLSRAWNRGGRAHLALERLVSAVPVHRLTFAPEPSFLEVLRGFGSSD
jgi:hypothetical protein